MSTVHEHYPGEIPAFFARRDPRVVLITFMVYTILLLSVGKYNIPGAVAFAAFPVFVLSLGRIPVRALLIRLAALSPFVLFVAAANPFLDRRPFIALGSIVLSAGTASGLAILIKGLLVLLSVLLLGRVLPFYDMCRALRSLHVPEPFVVQLTLLHRYVFLLLEEARAMMRARDMRAFGRRGRELRVASAMIGTLFLRTVERGDRIYRAMVARGFRGSLDHGAPRRIDAGDVVFLGLHGVAFLAIRIIL
jgi:cobalt/nickel transport system permease protein